MLSSTQMKIAIPSIEEKLRQHHIELWQEQGALHEMEGRGARKEI